jgi:hypothetical protein
MKYLWLFTILTFTTATAQAQAKRTTTKRAAVASKSKSKVNKRLKTSSGGTILDELECIENGPCSFKIRKGDSLVYEVSGGGQSYQLIIIPNKFDELAIADFNWVIPGPAKKTGHVVINTAALTTSKRYVTSLTSGEMKLTDASAFWLCNSSFKDIAAEQKQTSVTFDNGTTETFSSPEEDAVSTPIVYKGNNIELDGFMIQNKTEGSDGRKEIWILNSTSNLLMFKIDNGTNVFLLKEVKEKKKVAPVVKKK